MYIKIISKLIVIMLLLMLSILLHKYDFDYSFEHKPNLYMQQNYGRGVMYMSIIR